MEIKFHSIGNYIISSAIWDKSAQVIFLRVLIYPKLHEKNHVVNCSERGLAFVILSCARRARCTWTARGLSHCKISRQWHHVALSHGAFYVSRQHRLCRRWPGSALCFIHERLMCLFIVCGTMFMIDRWITSNFIPMQMTQKRKQNKWLQFLSGEDFSSKPLWNENADLKFSVNNERRRRQQETPEQREHSFYTVENPNLLVCRLNSQPIDQSFSSVLRP